MSLFQSQHLSNAIEISAIFQGTISTEVFHAEETLSSLFAMHCCKMLHTSLTL